MTPMVIAGEAIIGAGSVALLANAVRDGRRGRRLRSAWYVLGMLAGAGLGTLAWVVVNLPTMRGTMWSLKDMVLRVSAILCGLLFVIATLTALLPWTLDRL